MNEIILLGNLSKDPEFSTTQGGKDLCKFSIAVDRVFEDEGVDFFECVAWGKTAEAISKYFKKGKKILVRGRVKIDNYTNSEGAKRRSWTVVVERFYFTSSSGGESNGSPDSNREEDSYNEKEQNTASAPELDDDLPF